MTDIMNVPIRNCGFSTRLANILHNDGYTTTDDLFKKPMEELLSEMRRCFNFGKKSEEELKDWMYLIHSLNCSDFKKNVGQLADLYDLQAQVTNLIIQKQKQMDALLSEIEPDAYYYADAILSLAKKQELRS
jgi:hypothetical protein